MRGLTVVKISPNFPIALATSSNAESASSSTATLRPLCIWSPSRVSNLYSRTNFCTSLGLGGVRSWQKSRTTMFLFTLHILTNGDAHTISGLKLKRLWLFTNSHGFFCRWKIMEKIENLEKKCLISAVLNSLMFTSFSHPALLNRKSSQKIIK